MFGIFKRVAEIERQVAWLCDERRKKTLDQMLVDALDSSIKMTYAPKKKRGRPRKSK